MDISSSTSSPWVRLPDVLTMPGLQEGLQEGFQANMEDLRYAVPEVSMVYFQNAILPRLRPEFGDLSDIVTNLTIEAGYLSTHGPWTLFEDPPATSENNEIKVFQFFEKLSEIVRKEAQRVLPRGVRATTSFKCNPNMQSISSQREDTDMPDLYATLRNPTIPRDANKVYWDDVVVPGEIKKQRLWYTINDNNKKLMWSLNHAMRDTPRRRFVIGFTIENTSMRLWFCSRSDIIVSELFDFTKDHKVLVHFFLSIMFASPSDLGYDPTIVPVYTRDAKATGEHNIHVRSSDGTERVFQTTGLAANIGAEPLRGRGTRVWRVVELDKHRKPTAKKFVLKDSWIDHDRIREGDILAEIRKTMAETKYGHLLDNYLLTVECHGDVFIGGKSDNTHTVLRRGQEIPEDAKIWSLKQSSPREVEERKLRVGSWLIKDIYVRETKVNLYDIKSHYRIVFHEDGETIDKLTSLAKIWYNLVHVLLGLQLLHACGWIHRDISAGNILITDKYPKIIDLEYAKKVSNTSSIHLGRTGTYRYMSIEVNEGTWYFTPANVRKAKSPRKGTKEDLGELVHQLDEGKWGKVENAHSASDTTNEGHWKPNPLHDIESFWWLCVVLTICRAVAASAELDRRGAESHRDFVAKLLFDFNTRCNIMTNMKTFKNGIRSLPLQLRKAGERLEDFRDLLRSAYQEAEENTYNIDHTAANEYYSDLRKILISYHAELVKDDVQLTFIGSKFIVIPSAPVPPAASLSLDSLQDLYGKRLRAEIDDGQIALKPVELEAEDGPSSATDLEARLKQVRLSDSSSLVLKAPVQSVPPDSEDQSESELPRLPESSARSAKGKAPAIPKKKAAARTKTPNWRDRDS